MQTTDQEAPAPTPRQLALLSIPALVIGIITALMLWALEAVAGVIEDAVWTTLPDALGIDPSGWWIVAVLTTTGLLVGVCLQFIPGHGGPDSATTELFEPPLKLRTLPSIAIVTVLGLAGGVSLGPENPIIAINVSLAVALLARFVPRVPPRLAMLMAAAGTIGALFGTPVGAALLFTGALAAVRGGGSLWDKLFLPLASAAAGSGTMHVLGVPPLSFTVPPSTVDALDVVIGVAVACAAVLVGLLGVIALPVVHRAFHALRSPILIAGLGGLVLGVLGFIGGPITLFKGLDQMGELLANPDDYSPGDLVLIVVVKLVALVVAASAAFRGGRVFPATFIGVAIGVLASAVIPGLPLGLAVAAALIGMLLVATRDGWLSLFMAAGVSGDIGLLPWLCVIILPAWLLVTRAPEFRIVPKAEQPAVEQRS
ncbi:ion channel protein [Agromyces aurantiacus]|uniref:Ion channel protein n=1 Tax=Agromyces aurantiacus TaxID=165814 RepID=A0ABV9R8L9_9MICO|nr:ion channel protein [Agromyces aurantiacus]MBM7505180.1 H+/Cl- antiporter ClcA [Agromyces aurantiacus]